jgi:hypothetical protein
VTVLFFLSPGRASAGGIILITSGDTVNHVGAIHNTQIHAALRAGGWTNPAVGFKYDYFGIFWLDLWTWGGDYCVFEGKKYSPITASQAAELMGVPESELGKPFLYRFPLGLLILVGIAAVSVPLAWVRGAESRRIRRLFADSRYHQALRIMADHSTKQQEALEQWQAAVAQANERGEPAPPEPAPPQPDDGGFEEAVLHLVREGIPREEAEKNLHTILLALASHSQAA